MLLAVLRPKGSEPGAERAVERWGEGAVHAPRL